MQCIKKYHRIQYQFVRRLKFHDNFQYTTGSRYQSIVATSGLPGTSEFLVWSEGR